MNIRYTQTEWSDLNSERSYPLTVEATALDVTETFRIPDDFITGMRLCVPTGMTIDPDKFHIKSISNQASGFGIVIGYDGASAATASISRMVVDEYTTVRLTGVNDFIDLTGHITIGHLDGIDEQPAGQFTFTLADAMLEPDVVSPQIRTISSLRVLNGNDLSERLTGDIVLEAGANMRITVIRESGQPITIVFDAISGEGLDEQCACLDDTLPPIRTIDGVGPTADGRFWLTGNNCLEIDPITNGLQLKDTCSEPCCGCPELETVTSQLSQFAAQARTLENFLVILEAAVQQMELAVLGSRLGDRGCSSCS